MNLYTVNCSFYKSLVTNTYPKPKLMLQSSRDMMWPWGSELWTRYRLRECLMLLGATGLDSFFGFEAWDKICNVECALSMREMFTCWWSTGFVHFTCRRQCISARSWWQWFGRVFEFIFTHLLDQWLDRIKLVRTLSKKKKLLKWSLFSDHVQLWLSQAQL